MTLNCHILETDIAFDLIPTLRARHKYQLSSGSLVPEDYTQQNRWDYTKQNCNWEALENPQIDTLDPHFEKTTMNTYKSKFISNIKYKIYLIYMHVL